jgi:hypothetical protein
MNSSLRLASLLPVTALTLTLATQLACGSSTNIPPPKGAAAEATSDELAKYRGKLAELKAHRLAPEVAAELERAADWLETAKTLGTADPDSKRARLYLDAVRSHLVFVQSHYARREAEDAAGVGVAKATHQEDDGKEQP